jgi:anti-anti-sigma factor
MNGAAAPCSPHWLTVDGSNEDAVLVTVTGGIAADRAADLWAGIEEALEQATGRLVIADLTKVTGFDIGSIDALVRVAKASARRHVDVCILTQPNSAFEHYARCCELARLLPMHECVSTALSSVEELPRCHAAA